MRTKTNRRIKQQFPQAEVTLRADSKINHWNKEDLHARKDKMEAVSLILEAF